MEKKLIILAGPTGIGKTSLGIQLAQNFGSEIISCDSRQIFKEMCIGTAVPSVEELQQVKHHFIHTHSVHENYNASKYETEVLELLEKLYQKYELVFMVGGSGMYIDAVCSGIDDFPSITTQIRKKYETIYKNEGLEKLQQMVKDADPGYYKTVDLRNYKRLLKALELTEITGKPYSTQLRRTKKERPFKTLKIALDIDRDILYQRINERVLKMVEAGLVEEARSVYPFRENTSLKTVGYRELFEHFDGEVSLDEAITQIQNHTRAYARRQLTWLRRDKEYHWFSPNDYEKIKTFVEENAGC